jgi:hypothetical protein
MSRKMSRSHTVNRNVAIGLGVLCIILFLALTGVVNYYAPDHSRIDSLQNQVTSLNAIINLEVATLWANATTISQAAGDASAANYVADYAGYVIVNVIYSSTANTSVQVMYISHGVNYVNAVNVGSGGTALFPVLPATITVMVGNHNLLESAVEIVTIMYYY